MADYIKCPRCELNYIPSTEKYCQVCKAELKLGPQLMFAIDDDDETQILCPRCKQNYIDASEKMCDQCKEEVEMSIEKEIDIEKDEEWKNFVDDDEDLIPTGKEDGDEILLSQLEESEAGELFDGEEEEEEEEEFYNDEPDDFEDYPIDERDFEEEEDEEDEDEDKDDDF